MNLERRSAITFDEFLKVDMRVGTVVSVEPSPKARVPAYIIKVDLGPGIGIKQSSAQATKHYAPQELLGRQVVCVINFEPKNIAGVSSEVLVMGAYDGGSKEDVILLAVERPVKNGSIIG